MNETTDLLFSSFPDSAKVWIFSASCELSNLQEEQLISELQKFLVSWNAHGEALSADCKLLRGRFLIISAEEDAVKASGCSIDGLFRTVKSIGEQLDCHLSVSSEIYFLDGSKVIALTHDKFQQEVNQGRISESTIVFNNAVQTLGDIRSGSWQTAFKNSWHAKRFPLN